MSDERLKPLFLAKEDLDLFATEMKFKGMDPHLMRLAQKMAVNYVANLVFRDQRRYDLCVDALRFNHRLLFPSLSDKEVEHSLEMMAEYQSHIDQLLDLGAMSGPDALSQVENDPRWELVRKTAIQYGIIIGMKTNDAMNYALAVAEAGKARVGNAAFAVKRQMLMAEEIFLTSLLSGMEMEWVRKQSQLAYRIVEDYRQFTKDGMVKALDDAAEYHYTLLYSMKYPGAKGKASNAKTRGTAIRDKNLL